MPGETRFLLVTRKATCPRGRPRRPYLCGPCIPKLGMEFEPCFQYKASNQSAAERERRL